MTANIERALEFVRNFTEAEFHSFMEQLFVSESSQSNVSFNDLIGKNRFKNGIVCPHCNSHSAVRNGKRNGLQNYKCKECGKYFSNTTNTIALKSKYGLDTWKEYIECMMMGLSIRKSAAKCGISNATAFYWRHKILGALQNITEIKQKLSGIVEADETFFPLSYKGNHSRDGFVMPRRAKKRGSSAKQRGLSHNQVCVPCAVDRNNSIVALVSGTGKTSTDKVKAVLNNRIAESSVLVTDKESSYRRFARENNIEIIQIKAEQRTFKGIYHIQHINAFHSRLKSFMRPFQGVSTKHLNNYLVWYAWMQMNKELSEESLERNILNSSTSHNFRLYTSEISKKPVLPMAA